MENNTNHILSDIGSEVVLSNTEQDYDVSFFDKISSKDMEDLDEFLYEIIDELFEDEIIHMSKPNFEEKIAENIKDIFYEEWVNQRICSDKEFDEICEYIDTFLERTLHSLESEIPKRQYLDTSIVYITPEDIPKISKKIECLKNAPQPEQKSKEWYELRHNLITASNVHKLLGSELQCNSLIYEKCKPLTIESHNYFANSNNSRQWGIIYEPLSIKIYEKLYQTTVSDFGCIIHPKYNCIGASPDGINVDPLTSRFGRMIEVKNIVNRDITGIPKEEHWIQMQIQMETCDLNECDFIETRFKEYETSDEFYKFNRDTENRVQKSLIIILSMCAGTVPEKYDARYIICSPYLSTGIKFVWVTTAP